MRINDYIAKLDELADKTAMERVDGLTATDLKSRLAAKEPLSIEAAENIRKLIKAKKETAARRIRLEQVKTLCKAEFPKAEYEVESFGQKDCIKIWPEGRPDALKEPV